jgi:AcrR family transcriptional regulator
MKKLSEDSERHAPTVKGEARRARLLEVAAEEFLLMGYSQTSMKTIVSKAGGSATTAYQLFSNKEGLLTAVLQREFDGLEEQFFPTSLLSKPPATALPAIALRLLTYTVQPRSVDFYRLLVAEGHRIPGIAEYFRQLVSLQVVAPLERYLRDACESGELRVDDPARGARMIGSLLQGLSNEARIVGGYRDGLPAAEKDICRYSIESILRLWAVGLKAQRT